MGERTRSIVDILEHYLQFLGERMAHCIEWKMEKEKGREAVYHDVMHYLTQRKLDSFKKLIKLNAIKPAMFEDWTLTLTQMDRFIEGLEVIKLGIKEFPLHASLWRLYADLHCRQIAIAQDLIERNDAYKRTMAVCMRGIQSVHTCDAPMLWINLIDVMIAHLAHLSLHGSDDEKQDGNGNESDESDVDMDDNDYNLIGKQEDAIHRAFRRGVQECLSNNDELKEYYLQWMVMYHGGDKQRQLDVLSWFERQTMKCSARIYKIILDIYENLLLFENGRATYVDKVARFFEKCVNEHGKTDANIWIWYVEWTRKYRKLSVASSVYKRAIKSLNSKQLQVFLLHEKTKK